MALINDTLEGSRLEALVVTYGDFLERELRPLLTERQNAGLDALLKRAGDAYQYSVVPEYMPGYDPASAPTVAEASAALAHIHLAMPDGPEKSRLGDLMLEVAGLRNITPPDPETSRSR